MGNVIDRLEFLLAFKDLLFLKADSIRNIIGWGLSYWRVERTSIRSAPLLMELSLILAKEERAMNQHWEQKGNH